MEEGDVIALQQILYEFYTQNISNTRRREIEFQLASWQDNSLAWKSSLEILSKSKDSYLSMFCLSALEVTINRRWMSLDWQEKKTIKEFLYKHSLDSGLAPFIISKTVKLVVDTAKYDWPHFYPNFFANVMELMSNDSSVSLGLLYLRTISQELGILRQDLTVARNAELHKLLLSQMQAVFSCLRDMLMSNSDHHSVVLDLLNHLFSWVPADQIPQSVISLVLHIALDTGNPEKAILGLNVMIEILYRHWSPPCWQQFLQFIVAFLQAPPPNMDTIYLEKMSELLRLVLTAHMSRGADHMHELLSATLSWTMRQKSLHPGLTLCMNVWSHVLDHPSAQKYENELVEVAKFILKRVQWSQNDQMAIYDDCQDLIEEGDGSECPWQRALQPCLEVIAKVAEIQPKSIISSVITRWVELSQIACISSGNEPHLEYILRDLVTFTRAVGRLSPLWGERHDVECLRIVFSQMLSLSRLHYECATDSVKSIVIDAKCEGLAAMKASCCWLSRLPECEVREGCRQILEMVLHLLDRATLPPLQHCAAHLLASLTNSVRLADFWESTPLIHNSLPLNRLSKEDGYLVAGGYLNCLILPISREGNVEARVSLASQFIEKISQPLMIQDTSIELQIDTLLLLNYLVRLYESEGSKQKKLVCAVLQKPAERALELYGTTSSSELAQEILQFFKTLLECLQTQVGVTFVQTVVQTFLRSFSREKLQDSLARGEKCGLEHLLCILDLVVRTPALSAAGLTPLTIGLSLELSHILLKEMESPSIQEAYFTLVYSIVEHKWQYLVKGCVDTNQRMEEFLGLLRIMGRALLFQDINLFRLNLANFERLNQRWHLYSTTVFKKELLNELLSLLLSTLLNKNHGLLSDDIVLCICHLISADSEAFFNISLPSFLTSIQNIDDMQRDVMLKNFPRDMDLPSLTKSILRLISDTICYQTCNAGQGR